MGPKSIALSLPRPGRPHRRCSLQRTLPRLPGGPLDQTIAAILVSCRLPGDRPQPAADGDARALGAAYSWSPTLRTRAPTSGRRHRVRLGRRGRMAESDRRRESSCTATTSYPSRHGCFSTASSMARAGGTSRRSLAQEYPWQQLLLILRHLTDPKPARERFPKGHYQDRHFTAAHRHSSGWSNPGRPRPWARK